MLKKFIFIVCLVGFAVMLGSECPALSDAEQIVNLQIGAGLFFGGAGVYFIALRREGSR